MIRRLLLVAVLVAACSAPKTTSAPTITRVELRLLPTDGRAWVSIDVDGKARGGHSSGAMAPIAHTDSTAIAPDSVQVIFAAVRAIGDSVLARRGPMVDSSKPGTVTLAVTFSDSTQAQMVWASNAQPPAAQAQVVLEHILANRVGGW